jgi:hypothetical protein
MITTTATTPPNKRKKSDPERIRETHDGGCFVANVLVAIRVGNILHASRGDAAGGAAGSGAREGPVGGEWMLIASESRG